MGACHSKGSRTYSAKGRNGTGGKAGSGAEKTPLSDYKKTYERDSIRRNITNQLWVNYDTYSESEAEKVNNFIIDKLLKDKLIDEEMAAKLRKEQEYIKKTKRSEAEKKLKAQKRLEEATKRVAKKQEEILKRLKKQEEAEKKRAEIKKRNEEAKKEQEEFYKKVNKARLNGTLSQLLGNDREIVNGTYDETTSTYKQYEKRKRKRLKEMFK